ncbi:hypothetical protein J2728_002157 [Caulobacter segnis]|nr:hypothetical protein [Caulobacter segnis]
MGAMSRRASRIRRDTQEARPGMNLLKPHDVSPLKPDQEAMSERAVKTTDLGVAGERKARQERLA